ncbi:glycoside hydrolase family 9 protein [Natronospora cellulosivora (SeqCode)]
MLRKSSSLFVLVILFVALVVLGSSVAADEIILEEFPPGQLLKRTTFEDGAGLPWHVCENPPAEMDFRFEDNAYVIDIIDPNGADGEIWDLQFRHRDLFLTAGHTYEVSFTVEADRSIEIYPKIGDQNDPYFEDWNPNQSWQRINLQANQVYTHNETFTATRTADVLEFAFHLANAPAGTTIKFHEISLYSPQFPGHPPVTRPAYRDIRVNQLGYFPNRRKRATLNVRQNQANTPVNWWLEDSSGREVASGRTQPFGFDQDSEDYVHIIDFTDFDVEGRGYMLYADSQPVHGSESRVQSYPFDIATDMYSQMPFDSLKYFYYNRSGIPIEMPYAEDPLYVRPAGHYPDIMTTSTIESGDWVYNVNLTIDATGGWYDAGDHGKYVVNGGISVWTLMNMYERLLYTDNDASVYGDNTLNIPESGDGVPDLLNETRWKMECLLHMQVPQGYERAGMAFHKGHDDAWTGLAIYPHEAQDLRERILKPPTTAATLNLAATAAQASRLWEDYDPAFANELLVAAERAWQGAQENPAIFAPLGEAIGGGPYGDNYVDDEFYWAAAELFITTGKAEYRNYIEGSKYFLEVPNYLDRGEEVATIGEFNWGNVHSLGTLSLALVPNDLTENQIQEARASIIAAADYSIGVQEEQGYGPLIKQSPIVLDDLNIEGYPWGSNSFILNSAIVQGYAYDYTGNAKYIDAMIEAMDYILGRNPLEIAYVTRYGSYYAENPHHRVYSHQIDESFPPAPAGIAVGGPNSGLQDPWVRGSGWGPGGMAPQKSYMDHIESWSTNECTINWNAPLAWVSSYLDLNGDGDTPPPPPENDGDLNGDGQVNSLDMTLLQRYILTIIDDSDIVGDPDINGDGVVNSLDVIALRNIIYNQ